MRMPMAWMSSAVSVPRSSVGPDVELRCGSSGRRRPRPGSRARPSRAGRASTPMTQRWCSSTTASAVDDAPQRTSMPATVPVGDGPAGQVEVLGGVGELDVQRALVESSTPSSRGEHLDAVGEHGTAASTSRGVAGVAGRTAPAERRPCWRRRRTADVDRLGHRHVAHVAADAGADRAEQLGEAGVHPAAEERGPAGVGRRARPRPRPSPPRLRPVRNSGVVTTLMPAAQQALDLVDVEVQRRVDDAVGSSASSASTSSVAAHARPGREAAQLRRRPRRPWPGCARTRRPARGPGGRAWPARSGGRRCRWSTGRCAGGRRGSWPALHHTHDPRAAGPRSSRPGSVARRSVPR